ncbi:MAG: NIL domain-containing protein [Candidatus Tectomicrobia bacterium]|nr:NIL domain-containing protein [Candidatus Tectomicrobia bacterium]
MANLRVRLTFPQDKVGRPHIYEVGKAYDIVWSVRTANVTADFGWVHLELTGEQENLEKAIAAFEARGIRVDPIEGDVVAH